MVRKEQGTRCRCQHVCQCLKWEWWVFRSRCSVRPSAGQRDVTWPLRPVHKTIQTGQVGHTEIHTLSSFAAVKTFTKDCLYLDELRTTQHFGRLHPPTWVYNFTMLSNRFTMAAVTIPLVILIVIAKMDNIHTVVASADKEVQVNMWKATGQFTNCKSQSCRWKDAIFFFKKEFTIWLEIQDRFATISLEEEKNPWQNGSKSIQLKLHLTERTAVVLEEILWEQKSELAKEKCFCITRGCQAL